MKYYAAQVKTLFEEKYIDLFKYLHSKIPVVFYFPKRELIERHCGKRLHKILPLFPGYIFIETQDDFKIQDYIMHFRRIKGFFRFLRSNVEIQQIRGNDLEIIKHFIEKPAATSEISTVYFNQNDEIVVVKGALSGLEGRIVKIDKRKGRAKIKLGLCGESYTVDLGFETIESRKTA
ncbi:MAG: antiterminator LoaP [Spirochaetaceae bacterium]|jgi:transcriptional antiterminator NusG|nr:antiterminator LoaP [Spirochaetaceae bacterium]